MAEPRDNRRFAGRHGVVALVLGTLLSLPPRPARGEENMGAAALLYYLAPVTLLPLELGTFVHDGGADFSFGYSLQIPTCFSCTLRHRFAIGLDFLPWAERLHVRGRLGYRFATHRLITGLGGGLDHDGLTWSPELGVKFMNWAERGNGASLHVVVQAYLQPALDGVRGASLLLGWNWF